MFIPRLHEKINWIKKELNCEIFHSKPILNLYRTCLKIKLKENRKEIYKTPWFSMTREIIFLFQQDVSYS